MQTPHFKTLKRRDLFRMIGAVAGGSAMYQAMTSLGLAADSQYGGPIRLDGDPKGARVVVLGAGGVEKIIEVEFLPEEKAAFDKSCDAVKKLIEDFKKLGV